MSSSESVSNRPPRLPLDPKMSVDDFEFLMVIGKGSFGKVMQVRHKSTGSIYAMKILKKSHLLKRKQVLHTRTERAILANIRHPFIVSLQFAFQTPTKLYMVLDFFNGGELFFHLRRERRFPLPRARFYAAEIASAIGCLHKNGIIYRDLKPENILLGNDGHIRVTDFGLSKDAIESGELTHTFCGTPEYLAPEIIQQKGHSHAVDWWSLGILIYEMLLGMPPFYDERLTKMYNKILKAPIRFHRSLGETTRDLLRRLLNRTPKRRLGTVNDVEEVAAHPWFKPIDFIKLQCLQLAAPVIPNVEGDEDTTQFDKEFTDLPPRDTPLDITNSIIAAQGAFPGFSFQGKKEGGHILMNVEGVAENSRSGDDDEDMEITTMSSMMMSRNAEAQHPTVADTLRLNSSEKLKVELGNLEA